MQPLAGLHEIADHFDGFILDLWGVIHDGIAPFAGALRCLQALKPRPVLLLSNAPRRAASVQHTLRRLGIADELYRILLTSGEATWRALKDAPDPWFQSLGPRVFHIGPARDLGVLDGLSRSLASSPAEADWVLNTGPDDTRELSDLEAFLPDLAACLAARLPMVCANPDLEIVRGNARILCAGTLAAWYERQGAEVRWIGKPDPAIYVDALARLGLAPRQVLAVGDSLRTDIAGAVGAGLASLWILGGIHGAALRGDITAAQREAAKAGLSPDWVSARLDW